MRDMCLSYGECAAIEEEWTRWKINHDGDGTACSALRFIEEECAAVYPSDDEQDEIFCYIGCLEERE